MDCKKRCSWVNPRNELYVKYHDEEWGRPAVDDGKLFEMLILECFQCGLSWECILNRRTGFSKAFDGFDIEKVCTYDEEKLDSLAKNKDIIRNRQKIEAAVTNARVFRKIQGENGSFLAYLHKFTGEKVLYENGLSHSPVSDELSADLRRHGMKFIGTTVVYAYMQAIGLVFSHDKDCFMGIIKP